MKKEDKEDLFTEINDQINTYYSSYGNALNRASIQRSFGYGETQWTSEVEELLRRNKMPALKQNFLAKHIKSAVSEFASNIPSLAVSAADEDANALKLKAYQAIIDGDIMEKSKYEIINGYDDMIRTGMGVGLYIKTDYQNDHDFSQKIEIEYIDYQSLYFDPSSSKPTKCDGNYIGYLKRISKDQFSKKYPDFEPDDVSLSSYTGTNSDNWVFRSDDDQVILAHHFKKCYDNKKTIYRTSQGRIIEDKDELLFDEEVENEREVVDITIKSYIINGKQILEEYDYPINELPIIVAQGYQSIIEGEIYPMSFGTELEDMQRLMNLILTQIGAMTLYQRKNTTLWDKSIVDDSVTFDAIKNNAEQKDLFINMDAEKMPVRWNAQELPQSLLQLYGSVGEYMDSTLGRYNAAQGNISSNKSGIAASMEISQANLPIYFYITPMIEAIDRIGFILKKLIPKIYIEERTVKSKDGSFNINSNDKNSLNFIDDTDNDTCDISVKASASFEVQKQTYLNNMISIFQASPPELKTLLAPSIFELMQVPNLPEINDIYDKFIALSNPELYPILKEKDPEKVKVDIANMQQQQQQQQQEQQAMLMQKEQLEQQIKIEELNLRKKSLELEERKLSLDENKQNSSNIANLGNFHLENEKLDQQKANNKTKLVTEVMKHNKV